MSNIKIHPLKATLTVLLFLTLPGIAQIQAGQEPFSKKSLQQRIEQHSGHRWIMVLWSLDCPPCHQELSVISDLIKTNKNLAILLINTDDYGDISQERDQLLDHYGLMQLENFYFPSGSASINRFHIDNTWQGELPRSYMYAATGQRKGHSGLLSKKFIVRWLQI